MFHKAGSGVVLKPSKGAGEGDGYFLANHNPLGWAFGEPQGGRACARAHLACLALGFLRSVRLGKCLIRRGLKDAECLSERASRGHFRDFFAIFSARVCLTEVSQNSRGCRSYSQSLGTQGLLSDLRKFSNFKNYRAFLTPKKFNPCGTLVAAMRNVNRPQ